MCISDGVFIIGEAKSSSKGLGRETFEKLEALAKEIQPDAIVVAIGEKQFLKSHEVLADTMRNNLRLPEVEVRLLPTPEHFFERHTYPYIG